MVNQGSIPKFVGRTEGITKTVSKMAAAPAYILTENLRNLNLRVAPLSSTFNLQITFCELPCNPDAFRSRSLECRRPLKEVIIIHAP
jgi:hypothetical protein